MVPLRRVFREEETMKARRRLLVPGLPLCLLLLAAPGCKEKEVGEAPPVIAVPDRAVAPAPPSVCAIESREIGCR